MIEIAEIDHALDLARDRAKHGMKVEARQTLQMLFDALGWAGPEFVHAIRSIDTGGPVDWGALREEALATVNTSIIRQRQRAEKELRGVRRANQTRQQEKADRLALVRAVWRVGESAKILRRKLERLGEPLPLRTISRLLKEIRDAEN